MDPATASQNDLVILPPNRVWRTYSGGKTLDALAGQAVPADSHFAEDWIGSVTRAVNPGRADIVEGVSKVRMGSATFDFAELLASDPTFYLGADHVARHGVSPMLLVKFLDSAIRLHFQCHPSNEFARLRLNSPSGKTEAYHILGVREEVSDPFIYVGFQRPPTAAELRAMVVHQDMAALEACFDKIPVTIGDTFIIPGGVPHALGEGVFMIEIQEPTDFAVRFEFERGGFVLPEVARFMGRDVDFGLSVVDRTAYRREDIETSFRCHPKQRQAISASSWRETLIGPAQTPCFRVQQTHVHDACEREDDTFSINIVTAGELEVRSGAQTHHLRTYDKFFCPAGLAPLALNPTSDSAQILECFPPH
jgi:mannose-6-phosphate isomerase